MGLSWVVSILVRCPQCRRSRELLPSQAFDVRNYHEVNNQRRKEERCDEIAMPSFVLPVWCVECSNYWGVKHGQRESDEKTSEEGK